MIKLALHVLAGAALLSGPAYAFGGGPQAAAAAYCAARDAGGSHDAGIHNMSAQMVSGFHNTSITSMFATLTVTGKQTVQTSMYLAKQMCPQYFGGTSFTSQRFTPRQVSVSPEDCAAYPTLAATKWKGSC